MANSSNRIEMMKDDHNLPGLIQALRQPQNPEQRAAAAQALGTMEDYEAVESLSRSALEDPDLLVQSAARAALEQLVGNRSAAILDSYRRGRAYADPWVVETQAESMPENEVKAGLLNQNDLDGMDLSDLVVVLRSPEQPSLRSAAAAALGELGDYAAIESLARSCLEDPDPQVQVRACAALEQLVGNRAASILDTYRAARPSEEPWILDAPAALPVDDIPEGKQWDEEELNGLITVLRGESDTNLRLRAILALSQSRSMRAVEALALAALWSEEKWVRDGAKTAMERMFGDQTAGILESYRTSSDEDDIYADDEADDEDSDEDEDLEEDETPDELPYSRPIQASSQNDAANFPVMQEERTGGRAFLILFIVLLVAAVITYILSMH
jgi:HEAT repeat protein